MHAWLRPLAKIVSAFNTVPNEVLFRVFMRFERCACRAVRIIEYRLQLSGVRTCFNCWHLCRRRITVGCRNLFCDPWVDEAPLQFCVVPAGMDARRPQVMPAGGRSETELTLARQPDSEACQAQRQAQQTHHRKRAARLWQFRRRGLRSTRRR